MTRTNARQLALQLSFAVSAGSDVGPDAFFDEDYFRALPAEDALFTEIPGEEERAYISALVTGVRDHREELDDLIEQFSHGWKLSRISRTALAVLRVALYEILYMPDIPAAASINEAVELAKGYDEPETVRFINGILGSFMRSRGHPSGRSSMRETISAHCSSVSERSAKACGAPSPLRSGTLGLTWSKGLKMR